MLILHCLGLFSGCKMVSDRSPAGQIPAFTSEIYIYKPYTIKNGKKCNIICMKIEKIEWAHNSLLKIVDNIGVFDSIVSDGNYFYMLIKTKNMISFLEKLELKWTKEVYKENNLIEFKGFPVFIHILDEGGRELRNNTKPNPKNIVINDDGTFFNLYLCRINDTPYFQSLSKIEKLMKIRL